MPGQQRLNAVRRRHSRTDVPDLADVKALIINYLRDLVREEERAIEHAKVTLAPFDPM